MRSAGRAAYGVDLNRNYSQGWGGPGSSDRAASDIYRGAKPFSEPETQAIKSFIESNANITMLLSFHSFSELILYPWGNTTEPIPNERAKEAYIKMADDMAKWNGYLPMQASELYVAVETPVTGLGPITVFFASLLNCLLNTNGARWILPWRRCH